MLGFIAVPLWLVGMAACFVFVPALRCAKPHMLALPFAFAGIWLALTNGPESALIGGVLAPIPLLLWYVAVMRLEVLQRLRAR